MTTTVLFQGLAQDATLQQVRDLTNPVLGAFSMAGVGSAAQVDVTNRPIVTAQVSGQTGSVTMVPQVSDDGGTWTTVTEVDVIENVGVATGVNAATITANGTYRINTLGFPFFRLYQSAGTGSNAVAMASMPGVGSVRLGSGGAVRVAAQAAGAADPGIAGLAFRSPAAAAARSAAGSYTAVMADQEGKQVVVPHGATELQFQYGAGPVAAATDQIARAAGATGIRHFVTWATYSNESASPAVFIIKDGTTQIHRVIVPANSSQHFVFPTPLKGTAATALNVQGGATAAFISLGGFDGI